MLKLLSRLGAKKRAAGKGAATKKPAQAAAWVSWEVTGIFENIGTVQEGMQSIAVPHRGVDRPDARALEVSRGEIELQDVTFGYGRTDAEPVLEKMNLKIRPGER